MARLAAQIKMEYMPTPEKIAVQLARWFVPGKVGVVRFADTSVGEGIALSLFTGDFSARDGEHAIETIGIELSPFRADEAKDRLGVVLPCSFYQVAPYPGRWSNNSCSVVYNNPPYDFSEYRGPDGKLIRHERLFVTQATPKLVKGGHQVIIVPQHQLADETLVRHLLGNYDRAAVYRFPEEEFERYGQVVIFAIGRKKYSPPRKEAIEAITALTNVEGLLNPLPDEPDFTVTVPRAPAAYKFEYIPTDPADLVKAAEYVSAVKTPGYLRATYVRPVGANFNPVLSPKQGHMSLQISSGDLGIIYLDGKVVKGSVRKEIVPHVENKYDQDGNLTAYNVTEKEKVVSQVTIVERDGEMQTISGDAVSNFIQEHAEAIGRAILDKNTPLYDFTPTDDEWDTVSKVGTQLPPIPGRKTRGLFKVQKHLAIGTVRSMLRSGSAIQNFEMGTGKTPMTVASAYLLDAWPLVVVVPGHMPLKWVRTFEVMAPKGETIRAMVIDKPARAVPRFDVRRLRQYHAELAHLHPDCPAIPEKDGKVGKWIFFHFKPWLREKGLSTDLPLYDADLQWWRHKVRPAVEAAGGTVVMTRAENGALAERIRWYVEATEGRLDTGRRVRFTVTCQDRNAVISALSRFNAKHQARHTPDGLVITIIDRDSYTFADFQADYEAGILGRRAAAIISTDVAKYGTGLVTAKPIARTMSFEDGRRIFANFAICPTCGRPAKGKMFCKNEIETYPERPDGEDDLPQDEDVEEEPTLCGGPLFEMSRWRRVGGAELVKKKYQRYFGLYVMDEVHHAKNGSTDAGAMDSRLISATRYNLALTGTLMNGRAGSLFWLLYRRNSDVRQQYGHTDYTRWVDHYGAWKKQWSQDQPYEQGVGQTGIERWSFRQKELSVVSPAILRYLLSMTLFARVADLGYKLPPMRENIHSISMPEDMQERYDQMSEKLFNEAASIAANKKDGGGYSVWYSFIRRWPSAAFRPEVYSYKSYYQYPMEAAINSQAGETLPKEDKLVELVQENVRRGRKTLVYVEQTGTRDIRTRLLELLQQNSIRSDMMNSSMKPAKREKWIKENAPQLDVLIVNPALVETGLDLVMFSTIVFYEIGDKAARMAQAMMRVCRLGQKNEVDVHYLVWNMTAESTIFQEIGKALKQMKVLAGDEAIGALMEDDDDDDMRRRMIKMAMAGVGYQDLGELFGEDFTMFGEVFEDDGGDGIEEEDEQEDEGPELNASEMGGESNPWIDWMAKAPPKKKRTTRKKAAHEGQLSLL
jgi:hypothetical protein